MNDVSTTSSEDFPLMVRDPHPDEIDMVKANWKAELNTCRDRRGWGKGLRTQDFWRLINHVIDRITIPSAHIFVGAHPDNPTTPMIWMAVRDGILLQSYVRRSIAKDRALTAKVETTMLERLPLHASTVYDFDPFRELER